MCSKLGRVPLAALCLVLMIGSSACGAGPKRFDPRDAAQSQQYYFEVLRVRTGELQEGMTKVDVLLLLGTPAKYKDHAWIYLPAHIDAAESAEALTVRFKGDHYVEHHYEPILAAVPDKAR